MKSALGRFWSVSLALALVLSLLPAAVGSVQAVSPNVVISQVYGGGGNSGATYTNDFIELYNRGAAPVDITGWTVQYASTAGSSWQKTALSGTIQPGNYYLIQEAQGAGGTVPLPTPNAIGTIAMSGTAGKVALVNNSTTLTGTCPAGLVDFVGYGTATTCSETAPTANLSNTTAALRNGGGATDTDNNLADFTIGAPNPRNTPPPDAAPTVASTVPANGASGVAYGDNLTVTFSEPVNVSGDWFTLSCSTSGSHTAAVSGGPTSFTLDPASDFVSGDACTLTVLAANVTDQDTDDTPPAGDAMTANYVSTFSTTDACTLAYTPIYSIQGTGMSAAITGSVTTQGVVVGDYEGPSPAQRGFFLQDLTGDANTATSDGIFVFNGNNNSVSLGDVVRVTASASEFQDQTQLSSVTSILPCGTGAVTPVEVTLPVPSADFLEQYEGMLVTFPQTLSVTEIYQLGRFNEVLLSSGGRLAQPTNVVTPGADATALQAANNLNQILADDTFQNQNRDPITFSRSGEPLSASNTLRGGDTATGIVGILNYTWAGNSASPNAYRIRPVSPVATFDFEPANPRPEAAPAVPDGAVRASGMNVLNFFNTFTGCKMGVTDPTPDDDDCRGAENAFEFDRQWQKTVAQILGTNAAVIGITEMENDGYGPDSALAFLVGKLNEAAGPGAYAFIDADAATGQLDAMGTDAIKNAMIYKPARVTPVGSTAVLNSVEFVNGGDIAPRNRPALAQSFQDNATGGVFTAVINHLKSKGSACTLPDQGDGQGNCSDVRTYAANVLKDWLAADPTAVSDADVLILGDLNAYALEDPVTALKNAGYTDLTAAFEGPGAYSYVFDGQWGYLDHALGSASLAAQVTGVATWHINADEPSVLDYNTNFKTPNLVNTLYAPDFYRTADHDPVLVDLTLTNAAPVVSTIALSPNPVAIGAPTSLSVSFTDADIFDTHTASIDWGDGTTTAGTIVEASGAGTVTGSHAYAATGFYTVTVTVDDAFGGSGSSTFAYAVVVDPSNGFATGAGWFAGASGKVEFDFTAKYTRKSPLPEGWATLTVKDTGLAFSASQIDYLVVSGTSAWMVGSGTLNGASGYSFLIASTDNGKKGDLVRVFIWETATGAPVYDSQPGEPLPAAPTAPLGGGAITIHP